ncbi:MAG TPA: hypothetical protein VMX17_06645 [Candidatus Glassbacteria bacterium]|nr:hypothetical protein [Candidatus Glassbacteria bacterium]
MNTPVEILRTIVKRMQKVYTQTDFQPSQTSTLIEQKKELRQEMSYSIDLLKTIIDLEDPPEDQGNNLLP